jgi:hypothetical protein
MEAEVIKFRKICASLIEHRGWNKNHCTIESKISWPTFQQLMDNTKEYNFGESVMERVIAFNKAFNMEFFKSVKSDASKPAETKLSEKEENDLYATRKAVEERHSKSIASNPEGKLHVPHTGRSEAGAKEKSADEIRKDAEEIADKLIEEDNHPSERTIADTIIPRDKMEQLEKHPFQKIAPDLHMDKSFELKSSEEHLTEDSLELRKMTAYEINEVKKANDRAVIVEFLRTASFWELIKLATERLPDHTKINIKIE